MQNNVEHQVYAGFFVRLAAYFIDCGIVGAALLLVRIPAGLLSLVRRGGFLFNDFIFQYSIYDIVLYLLKLTYFVLLTYFTGATLGKRLFHLRIVSSENRKPTFFEIAFRESVGRFLSSLILCVGYIMAGADKQKRGLHDILSDTFVVYYHQKTVAIPAPVAYNKVPYAVQVPPNQAGAAVQGKDTPPVQEGMPIQDLNAWPVQAKMPMDNVPPEKGNPEAMEKDCSENQKADLPDTDY